MCFPVFLSAIEDDREGVPTPPDRVPGANALITIRDFLLFFFGLSLNQHKLTMKIWLLCVVEHVLSLQEWLCIVSV